MAIWIVVWYNDRNGGVNEEKNRDRGGRGSGWTNRSV